jgi:hypothetical protein
MRDPRLRAERRTTTTNVSRADGQHDRHEDPADPIGQPLDRRLGTLGSADQVHDLGQRRVAPDPRRPEQERAVAVHRGADDLIARALVDRQRLAGEHRLVDRGVALDDAAVDRHATRRGARGPGRRRGPPRAGRRSRAGPRTMRADRACRPSSSLIAPTVWPFARASSQRPIRIRPTIAVELSK